METEPSNAEPPKCKRRWFQFSLRTTMVAVTLLCIWLGVVCNRANRQRRAVEALTKAGGYVWYDYEADEIGRHFVNGPPPSGPEWLRNLIGMDYFETVASVNINIKNAADEDSLSPIVDLPHLRGLSLTGASVTDSMLVRLKGLTKLRCLSVFYATSVSDDGWVPLAHLTNLTELNLIECHVTDSALPYIEGLTQLESLWLTGNAKVTDAGLQNLKALTHLKYLQIGGTEITPAGVEDLKRALPTLIVSGP
jgi:hypothetical protein